MPAPFGLPAELAELRDDYELRGELGRGGAAVVYRATDRALGRDVAIKVVHPRPTSPDDDPVARLGREARTVAQLQHPNIVAVYAVRRLRGGGLALVMQCVPGATLKAHVQRRGPLAPEECERLLRDVGSALAYAHAHGVVHRDVKPENIFLDEGTGRALLSDFGIAQAAGADSLTMTGTAVGTPFYMSPEQVDDAPLDGRSDLYSLGLVAWEALTGRRPWDGESLYNIIYKQKHDELPPVEALRPDVPLRLQYVIERMLQKRPGARWAGAEGLLAQLDHAVLPGDYRQWQRALAGRVARFHDAERERAAQRRAEAAPADVLPSASTVHFTRERFAVPASTPDDAGVVHSTAKLPEPAQLANTLTLALVAGDDGAARDQLPAPGATFDLRQAAAAGPSLPPAVAPRYDDTADPTWAEPPGAPALPAPRRRTAFASTAAAAAVLAAAGAVYTRAGAPAPAQAGTTFAAALGAPAAMPDPAAADGRAPSASVSGGAPSAAERGGGTAGVAPRTRARLSAGGRHSCLAPDVGPVYCWGANDRGQLGDGTAATQSVPAPVAGVLTFASVSAGLAHTCAVTRIGDVYCWGSDTRGQLGDATTVRRNAPVRVAGADSYASVSAGAAHSCGVTTAGTLRCWGANDQGQLGNGSQRSHAVPTLVALPRATVLHAAAGGQHSCAVTEGGRVQCWGGNRDGQLGDGQLGGARAVPGPVTLPTSATTVSLGLAHSCALTADGAGWCWGRNESGQIGDGSRTARPRATRVRVGDAPLTDIVSGAAHSCALDAAGAVWCWGRNSRGAVGDGTTANRAQPATVRLPGPAVAVAAGTAHSCATLADDRTFCWGDNADGQLGNASRRAQLLPTLVRDPIVAQRARPGRAGHTRGPSDAR